MSKNLETNEEHIKLNFWYILSVLLIVLDILYKVSQKKLDVTTCNNSSNFQFFFWDTLYYANVDLSDISTATKYKPTLIFSAVLGVMIRRTK